MAEAHGHLLDNLVRFAELLRGLGLNVTTAQLAELGHALTLIDITEKEDVRAAAATIFVRRQADISPFEMAFDQFFRDSSKRFREASLPNRFSPNRPPGGGSAEAPLAPTEEEQKHARLTDKDAGEPMLTLAASEGESVEGADDAEEMTLASYSPTASFSKKDFGEMSAHELDAVKRFLREHRFEFAGRTTRRLRRAARGPRLDLRRMLRGEAAARLGPPVLCFRARKQKPRPVIVLCDVSGSMEPYARVLLAFIYALTHKARRVEAFGFSTELARITRALREREIDSALRHAAALVPDFGGGTRIGAALKSFNFDWACRTLGQGPIVLIISDGWDRGDTTLLAREMERLSLSCHALIWLNPLAGMPGFEPLQKGLMAALPFVDHFLPVHNLDSLEKLARLLTVLDTPLPTRRTGRFDKAA
ncbi:MAG: VWA domain-containing protein [Alphaproteobacteria bacterium]|nr:VWA domain-containing protein [Alphaproteobacteria bacterium]